ncbi:amidohydrolase family protein [Microbacteriaceae bacterium VKM Ac-2855]|nr:amidohydrolase family protein [Microbacteriaceae bacterium VKM Ac-2855]
MPTILRDVRPWGGEASDVVVDETGILAIEPVGTASDGLVVEGRGGILVPSFSDVHVHLDSTRMGLPFRPRTGESGRWGRIMNDRENWRSAEASVADRATYTLRTMIEKGATRVRSHAQVDADTGLEKFEGVLAAREAHRDQADVEIVAFPQVGIFLEPGVVELLDEALALGGDLIGGIDPCEIDRDPIRHLDAVFALAEKRQVGIDIHLHEGGSLGLFSMELIAERTRALGMAGKVSISHAFALASDEPAVAPTIGTLASLDIALTNIAPGKGLELPLLDLLDAGVRVGLGMDGQRDYWSPWGNGDMLERTFLLAHGQGYSDDALIEHALAVATWGGATVIDGGLTRLRAVTDRPGTAVGDPAELVILRGDTPTAAVMDRALDRTVIHRGRVVAESGALL